MVSESEEIDLAPVQNPQTLFHDVSLQFNCGGGSGSGSVVVAAAAASQGQQRRVGDPVRKTRGLSGFVEEKMFGDDRDQYFRTTQSADFRRSIYGQDRTENRNWNGEGSTGTGTASEDGSEGDEDEEDDDDDDDDVDEGDGEVEGLVVVEDGHNKNNSSGSVHSSSEKLCNDNNGNLQMHHSSFGSNRGLLVKDGNVVVHSGNVVRGSSSEQHHQEGTRLNDYENLVTVAEPDSYYSRYLQGSEGTSLVHKVIGAENGCGHSDRKNLSMSKESGDSLREILSDPVTADLMDDAMILPCGHSFGSGGVQQVLKMKACYTCSQPVSENSVAPNLSLRSAVQAFRREEELQSQLAPKRRSERFEQNNCSSRDPFSMDRMDHLRGKGVQFPFAVTDRVIIKGNKRTPLRFVGREAVVTTQCLNGWYVVKTLDNAESVKLQYRSLAKAPDTPSSNINSSKHKEERGETQPFYSCILK